MDLSENRQKIDDIDSKIVDLFKERMAVAKDIACYKKANNLNTLDSSRERALLNRISDLAGTEFEGYARMVYSQIMEVSKSYQHGIIHPDSVFINNINSALDSTPKVFPDRAEVACQGVEGAYSQMAAERVFKVPNIHFCDKFEDVFTAVENGDVRFGILPIENSTAGSVKMTYDLMSKHDFCIVRSVRIKVDHNLLANKGTKIEDIKEVYSHEQAISQCSEFLKTLPGVKITVVKNTALASKLVMESGRKDIAALSSYSCAKLYNLDILKESVQDNGNNYTRFICFEKKLEIYPGADRTSLILTLEHKPGALYQLLSKFYALGINVIKIESRPIPDRNFEFMFYFDIEESVYSDNFKLILSELEYSLEEFKYLGSYSELL